MTALALKALAAASAAGVTVILDGDGLILDPTPAADLVAELKAVKPDLLRVLARRVAARAVIHTAEPPVDCLPHRWEVARRGLKRFLDEGWGDQAALIGWTSEELYAVPPVWARVDLCGAALLIADRRVVAITEATITTVGVTGSHLKFYRAGRARIAEDAKGRVVKAHVAGLAVNPTLLNPDKAASVLTGPSVSAAGRADHAACTPLCLPARPEPARLTPVLLASTSLASAPPYPFYEFFAGGGMARAGMGSGWTCTMANDISPMKIANYTRNWGRDGVKTADVARLKTADLPGHAALLWASFPCQDLSEAGAGAALGGYRSNALWPCFELIRGLRAEGRAPRTIVLENVTGLLSLRGDKFFDAICDALAGAGYRFGVVMIDAALFVPQSRQRVFFIGVDNSVAIPADIIATGPTAPFHSPNLVKACQRNTRHKPIWFKLLAPPRRHTTFADIIEDPPTGVAWHSRGETDRLIGMMAPMHLAKLEAAQRASLSDGKRRVGSYSKRMRADEDGRDVSGERIQCVEIRFDDIAGCLRVAGRSKDGKSKGGGSSRAMFMLVDGDAVRSRLMSPRECARLQGLPDNYRLPANYDEACGLMGDGLAVPVVRWLAEHILEPIMEAAALHGRAKAGDALTGPSNSAASPPVLGGV